MADLHVPVAPDGDIALFNALLAELRARGRLAQAFIDRNVEAPPGFWDSLDRTAHGIDPATFAALADLVAARPRMITLFSQGINQSRCGTDKGNAIINLHLATGRINAAGAGPFSITGQPNAMGGREVGGLATMLACHLGFSEGERADVARFWNAPNLCAAPGLKAVDLFRAVHDGRVKFLWVMATNPAVSMPDAGFVREALARCPTLIVSDVIADTDTGRLAHVRLPALAWGEKDGTVTNSERMITRQRALFSAAPGEARADWQIMCDVAARMGWADSFDFAKPVQVFREYAAMTGLAARRGKVLDLTGHASIDDRAYEALAPFRWGGEHPLARGFPTPGGKARMVAVSQPVPRADGQYPLRLNTGRYRDQWHTMTRTGLSPTLSQHRREPLLEIAPVDAVRHGVVDGGLARVTTRHGAAIFRVRVEDDQRSGEVFVPMHWTDALAGEARANRLTEPATDPFSGQPGFKDTPACVEPVVPDWHAFLVTRDMAAPADVLWWSRSRVPGGWLCELAGTGAIDCDTLLGPGERVEVADHARGMRRIAVRGAEGKVAALLYATRSGVLPPREWAAGQLGTGDALSAELLAGRPNNPLPDRGAIVCVCHGIGEHQISIAACSGAITVAAIGEATAAGTNCGSCRPAISRLIGAAHAIEREAAE